MFGQWVEEETGPKWVMEEEYRWEEKFRSAGAMGPRKEHDPEGLEVECQLATCPHTVVIPEVVIQEE